MALRQGKATDGDSDLQQPEVEDLPTYGGSLVASLHSAAGAREQGDYPHSKYATILILSSQCSRGRGQA